MTFFDIDRILLPIKRKLFLIIGRAILTAVDNSGGTQKIQVTGLEGETITGIERFQEYGFESYPKKDAEVVIGFINGNRDQGIALRVHDRTYRPTNLSEGEVMVYHFDGDTKIHIKEGEIDITGGGTLEFAALPSKIKTEADTLIDVYNSHVHVDPQGGSTAIPTQQMTKPNQADYSSDEVKIS